MTAAFAIVPQEALRDKRLPGNAKALLSILAGMETLENKRWVRLKQKEMGEQIGVARETVNRLVKKLLGLGYLESRNVTTRARGRVSLQYRIVHDLPDAIVEAEETPTKTADVTFASPKKSRCDDSITVHVADVIAASPEIVADVTATSLPIRSSYLETRDNLQTVEPSFESPAPVARATPKRKPSAGPVTLDLEMSDRMVEFAGKHGFLNGSGIALFERFRAHHSAKGSMFVSFDAAFQTWVLNELKFNQQRTSNDQRNSDGGSYASGGDRTRMARTSTPPSGRRRSRTMAEAAEWLIDELTGSDGAGEAPGFGGAPLLTYRPA